MITYIELIYWIHFVSKVRLIFDILFKLIYPIYPFSITFLPPIVTIY